jgi:hypothetical protein
LEPEGFSPHFWQRIACFDGFFREPENGAKRKNKKGRRKSRPSAILS